MKHETTTAENLRLRICRDYGATWNPKAHSVFFEMKFDGKTPEQTHEMFLLDALYTALVCADDVIAFRCVIQAERYVAPLAWAHLRYKYETALFDARRRIEDALRGEVTL